MQAYAKMLPQKEKGKIPLYNECIFLEKSVCAYLMILWVIHGLCKPSDFSERLKIKSEKSPANLFA